jgi:hypothetical protein
LIEKKNRELGKYLRKLGIRYGEPFILQHTNGDGKYISHSCNREKDCHPKYMIDVFCFYGSRLPMEYNNSLQLYDVNATNYTNEIKITRSPFWVNATGDKVRVDEFLDKMAEEILSKNLKVVTLSDSNRSNLIMRTIKRIFHIGTDKLGERIAV